MINIILLFFSGTLVLAGIFGFESLSTNYYITYLVASSVCGIIYLLLNISNTFRIYRLLVLIVVVANTFPALPYLALGSEPVAEYGASCVINSIGLLCLVFFFLILEITVLRNHSTIDISTFCNKKWEDFFETNRIIFLITAPFVFVAALVSGGLGYALGSLDAEAFSRTGSFKGLGPIMVFSTINSLSGVIYGVKLVYLEKKLFFGIFFLMFLVTLNGFTLSRAIFIQLFFTFTFSYSICKRITIKFLIISFSIGCAIVMLQLLRTSVDSDNVQSASLRFFLKFSGDFDSLNNVGHLVSYIKANGYFGFYHIWSFILNPIPRAIFENKPHFIGILYLNDLIFPGLYLGRDGGSNMTFGLFGTWYAAYGIITLLFGIFFSVTVIAMLEINFQRWKKYPKPSIFIFLYLIFLGNIIIFYRDGLSTIISILYLLPIYSFLFFALKRKSGSIRHPIDTRS